MIRFIRDPQPPYTQYKQGMVRDLGASLETIFIASGDAVASIATNLAFPPPAELFAPGTARSDPRVGFTGDEASGIRALVSGDRFAAGKYKRIAFLGDSFFEPLGDVGCLWPESSANYAATNGVSYGAEMGGTWTGAGQLNELGVFAVHLMPYYGFTHPTTYSVRFDGVSGMACKLSTDSDYGPYVDVSGGGFFVLTTTGGLKLRAVLRWRNRPAGVAVTSPTTANALSLIGTNSFHSIASRIYMQAGVCNSSVACFGITGGPTTDMLARIAQVTAWQPDLVILGGPVNDYGAAIAGSTSIANYAAIWAMLAAAGANVAVILLIGSVEFQQLLIVLDHGAGG